MKRHERIKEEIVRSAARLLFEEEVRSYSDARRQATRRFGSSVSASKGAHLPACDEIHIELQKLMKFYGGAPLVRRVREWRLLALKYLQLLAPFQPLLVGSVLRAEVRAVSDINLQLFCDKPEEVGYFLKSEGVDFYEQGDADDVRFYLEEAEIEIECTVYPLRERRQIPHCRITGAQMERAGYKRLRTLLDEDKE